MTHPTTLIPVTPPLPPLEMVNLINDWMVALRESWLGPTVPIGAVEGQIWLDTNTEVGKRLKILIDGSWRLLLSDIGPWASDFNATLTDGSFRFNDGALNSPFPGNSGTLIVSARDGAATQIVLRQNANEADLIHIRTWLGGSTFTPWRTVFTQADIVGVVSRAGGVPTGAIIESDVLANGAYTRWASGDQMCRATRTLTRDNVSRLHNLWNFPRDFVNNDYQVTLTLRSLSANPSLPGMGAATIGDTASASQLRVLQHRTNGSADFAGGDTCTMDCTVWGRWAS